MRRSLVTLPVLLILLFASTNAYASGFVWEPTNSSYLRPGTSPVTGGSYVPTYFMAINPTVAALAGLGTGEGYGLAPPDYDGPGAPLSAFGGPAPASLVAQGINERPGHYYFGFANTYPTVSNFSAYELGSTRLKPGTVLTLSFLRTTTDPINFIGICGDPTAGEVHVDAWASNDTRLLLQVTMADPVYSVKGGGDQDSVFGLYINYGDYDADNQDVDFDGAVFRTNIHWWDIDVPAVPNDRLASLQLATQSSTDAIVTATVPDSFFASMGVDPENVRGYVDETEIPLGQGLDTETYSFAKVSTEGQIMASNGLPKDVSEYVIHSDQWSTHDISVGLIPEPTTLSLLVLGGLGALIRRRR